MCTRSSTASSWGARLVWMPTFSSANHINHHKQDAHFDQKFPQTTQKMLAPIPLSVLDSDGKLKEEVKAILDLIADADIVLSAGHLNITEIWPLFEEARKRGVKRLLVNHPTYVVDATLDDMRQLAKEGVYMEHSMCMWVPGSKFRFYDPEFLRDVIEAGTVDLTILGSDLGQKGNPTIVEGFRSVIETALDIGYSEADIRKMTSTNAARLMNIELPASRWSIPPPTITKTAQEIELPKSLPRPRNAVLPSEPAIEASNTTPIDKSGPALLESVAIVFRLLDELSAARRPLGVTELADIVDEPKPRVYRHLASMRQMGAVEQDPSTEKYRLGAKLVIYGTAASEQFDLRAIADPYLTKLRDTLGQSAVLSVVTHDSALVVAAVDSNNGVCITVKPGNRVPAHCSAQGRLVLAFLPPEDQQRILRPQAAKVHGPARSRTRWCWRGASKPCVRSCTKMRTVK